ncbi:serine hydrolase domain-containing protein [Flavobacterium taihuense]|uniref:Beta-lactamase family protein n=1 Tax=Flavobacterium taihuense TaxID=2857508 RepID=A0ABS6XRJ3_9FLAO|nr:serine hydrolase [Flavobacterium taihuense]MBW4358972.1 beta-lactamase family protein [Flavobacterium taihuense]
MKKYFRIGAFLFLLFLGYLGFTNYPKLELISGFSAKSVTSGHFIDHRSQEIIEKNDNDFDVLGWATNQINESEKFATATVLGLKQRKAIYRAGLGGSLINDDFDVNKPYEVPKRTKSSNNLSFPYGDVEPKDTIFSNVNYTKLNQVVANAFDAKGNNYKRTRSVLVIYKDKIIAEKYADGFTKSNVILGWSMTKSITGTLFGILENQRRFDIYKPAPIAEWQNDNRKYITTNDLLHMNSGLEWDEYYDRICDATKMLYQEEDMTRSQVIKPALFKPNTHWNYSSGTTNLLSGILRKQFKSHQEYLDFWYSALIDKIGMHSMLVETDMAGNYVGSSYAWATTRDWSKLGLLYLHQGNWNGEQLFDPSWAKYVATPTDTSHGRYGAQFWLNAGNHFPNVPRDMYYCSGFQGQMVAIIPSMDLVIVRMGLTEEPQFDFNGLLSGIVWSVRKN